MSTISLCIIVKNEEAVLERCLKSIKNVVDEIIIVDTGSTDKTKSIAKKFTEKVFDFKWINDFSAARNYSFSLATKDYIMWLDADDVVPKRTAQYLIKLKQHLSKDVYMLKYNTGFSNNKPTFSFYRERIIKNCTQAHWQGCVHECITPFGNIERLNLAIEHRKVNFKQNNRNLNILKQTLKQRQLSPRELYYFGRELFDHKQYKKCISVLNKFINSKLGWVENIIDSYDILHDCYMQLNNANKALNCLFRTFSLDLPRANICCKIGDFFINLKKWDNAIYWHKLALNCQKVDTKGAFVYSFYYNYYPYLQLCKSYYEIGNIEKSKYYNDKAGKIKPDCQIVKNNKIFFSGLSNKDNL